MGVEYTYGPIHSKSENNKIPLDTPSPDLKSGQSAVTSSIWVDILNRDTGEWQWTAKWEILENS